MSSKPSVIVNISIYCQIIWKNCKIY